MDFPLCAFNAKIAQQDLQATIQEQIVDEEWQEPQQIEESYCFPAEMSSVCHPELAEGNCPP